MNVNKLFIKIAWGAILSSLVLISILIYWGTYPYKVLSFNERNAVLLENTVKSGGYLSVKENYCKHMSLPSRVSRTFIDGIIYQVQAFDSDRETGCHEKTELIYVPKALPVGDYKLTTVYSYKVNPIRTVEYKLETAVFTITK
jgi:hypothetical protein